MVTSKSLFGVLFYVSMTHAKLSEKYTRGLQEYSKKMPIWRFLANLTISHFLPVFAIVLQI